MAGSKKYHPSEISLHTSNNDCWLVIHGKVYDVTAFLEDHPGGDEVLIEAAAAGDATDAFEDVGHSSSATDMMERYFIGVVEEKLAAGGPKAVDGASTKGALKSRKFQGRKAFSSSIISFFSHLVTRGDEELMEGLKRYHPTEISLHTSKKDCWLVIHGKVYDVTAFLEDHPGGDDILIQAAGAGDATDAFEDVGHSSSAASMMEGYFIGVVEGKLAAGGPKAVDVASTEGSLESRTLQERKASSSSSIISLPSHLVTRDNREFMEGSKRYHPSEISLHTSKKDCWLVIHGKVYDVTAFLEDHPGGDDVLIQAAGAGDATDAFEDVCHSSSATSMMECYFIGVVDGKLAAGEPKATDGSSAEGSLEKGKFIAFVSPEAETKHPEIELKPGIDLVGPRESYDATTYFESAVMAGLSMHRKNTGKDGELPNSIAQSNKLKLFSAPQGLKEAKSPHQTSSNHEILFNSKVRGRQNQTDQSTRAELAHLMETVGKSWRTISEYPESTSEEDGELIFDTIVGKIDLSNLQLMNNEDLVELAELGSGAFGTVYHGKWRGTDVAIKRINKNCFTGRQDRLILETLKEAGILANLLHPNIVSLYGFVLDELGSTFAIVTELVADGSLRNILLREDKYLDHYTRLIIAKSAASGMEYLHLKKIVHFDLKCDNLLVDLKDPSSPICKVADFGLSKVKQETLVSGGARGTIPWMAPELFKEDISKVSEKIDVYSFGIVMWEILTGEVPYTGLSQGQIIGGIFRDTLRPPVPASCDPRWRRLMEECWASDPQQRPSFTQIARRLHSMLVASHSETLK